MDSNEARSYLHAMFPTLPDDTTSQITVTDRSAKQIEATLDGLLALSSESDKRT